MRRTGFVDAVGGLGSHDHLCWVFNTPREFRSAAAKFLTDGLAAGQRVYFVGRSVRETDLDFADGFAAARAAGAAHVQDVGVYDAGRGGDPAEQVEVWAQTARRALADGFAGLRVAADVTSLVDTPAGREAFGRYEFLIDMHMARNPLTGMCGFDRRVLGDAVVTDLACMHPVARRASTVLRVHASAEPGVSAVVAGEVDIAGYELLRTALSRIDVTPVDGRVTVDGRGLSFIDHRGLIQLVQHIRNRGATTELLVDRRSVVTPLADLLRLPDLRVEVTA